MKTWWDLHPSLNWTGTAARVLLALPPSMRYLCLLLFCATVLRQTSRPAAAEINGADSIEWATIDADLVVRGSVSSVALSKAKATPGWFIVTLSVAETLKGKAQKRVTFLTPQLGNEAPDEWQAKDREILLFLVRGSRRARDDNRYASATWAPRRSSFGDPLFFILNDKILRPAFNGDFAVLADRNILQATIRTAATSNATKVHKVDLPFESPAFTALWGGSSVWLYVPADAALEARAITWLAAKDLGLREEGVKALANFPSSANITRLKALLDDAAYATVTTSDRPTVQRYLVRIQADMVLTQWAVPHRRPVLEITSIR